MISLAILAHFFRERPSTVYDTLSIIARDSALPKAGRLTVGEAKLKELVR